MYFIEEKLDRADGVKTLGHTFREIRGECGALPAPAPRGAQGRRPCGKCSAGAGRTRGAVRAASLPRRRLRAEANPREVITPPVSSVIPKMTRLMHIRYVGEKLLRSLQGHRWASGLKSLAEPIERKKPAALPGLQNVLLRSCVAG